MNSGFSFFRIFISGKKEKSIIIRYEILLLIKPSFGKYGNNLNLKLITLILFFFNNSKYSSHSPQVLIIETLYFSLEYLDKDIAELSVDFTVPTLLKQGDQ
jgi:hypothetical protein